MAIQVALLRAINLGRRAQVSMSDLRDVAEELGFEDARTYLRSGNLIYSTRIPAPTAESQLEAAIARVIGLETDVIVRTAAQLRAVVERNPFVIEAEEAPARLQVMFCKQKVKLDEVAGVRGELVEASGKELYIYVPDGVSRSRLSVDATGTARNWNTVRKLATLSEA